MENVFEPMNFAGEVFEPTANFGGDVFEPMNFAGRKKRKRKLNANEKRKIALALASGGILGGFALANKILKNKKSKFDGDNNFAGEVFEPTANFGGDVFEPTANFGGDVFEPMNFDGEYSNFGWFDKKKKTTTSAETTPTTDKKTDTTQKPKRDLSKLTDSLLNVVKTGVDTYTQLAPIMQKPEFQRNLEATCGKAGTFLGIGKPRQSYLECAKNFMERQGVSNAQFEEWKNSLNSDTGASTPPPTGMSLGAKIGITAGILAVVGVGAYFIFKGKK